MGTLIQAFPDGGSGSSGGGHTIENSSGTDMTQRANMQFVDAQVSDDSTNDRTKIENVKVIDDESDMDDLGDGLYMTSYDDADGTPITADMIDYDENNTVEDKISALDTNKISKSQTAGLVKNDGTIDTESYTDEIDAIVNVYGGKNLLKTLNRSGTIAGNVTYVTNSDGSITFNGTATQNDSLNIYSTYDGSDYLNLKNGEKYILSCPELNNTSIVLQYIYNISGWNIFAQLNGSDYSKEFTYNSNNTGEIIQFIINSGEVLNNVTFHPMIRDPRVEDSTYVPYAMTNRELTERLIAHTIDDLHAVNLVNQQRYTVTTDGYLLVGATSGNMTIARIYCANQYIDSKVHDGTSNITFVKKGMTVGLYNKTGTSDDDYCYFMPIN